MIPIAYQPYLKNNDYDRDVTKMVLDVNPDPVVDAHIWRGISGAAGGAGVSAINLPGAFDEANVLEGAYEAFQRGQVGGTRVMVHRVIKDVDRCANRSLIKRTE